MGAIFVTDKDDEREVSQMNSDRSRIFVGVTNGFAEAFGRPRCIDFDGAHYVINEDDFCDLVEFVFMQHPTDIMFGWAERACGIYQTIKGQLFEWHWMGEVPANCSTISISSSSFQPVNTSDLWPIEHSGKEIGRARHK